MMRDAPSEQSRAPAAVERLRRRPDFLRASASGVHHQSRVFKIQMAEREDREGSPRVGFTVTKRVAGAVGRNRIRRRLKEAMRIAGAPLAEAGRDYVFVARPLALTAPFQDILTQIADGLTRLNRRGGQRRRNQKDRASAP